MLITVDVFALTSPEGRNLVRLKLLGLIWKKYVGHCRCITVARTSTPEQTDHPCASTCDPASVPLRARVQVDVRGLLSLASAPLLCDWKPIPLVNRPPKSYDWGYAKDKGSSCCNFVSVLGTTHTSVTGDTHNQLSICDCLFVESTWGTKAKEELRVDTYYTPMLC